MRNQAPTFSDYERGPDFDRARTQIATPFQYLDIALDTALVNQQYPISGDFLYVDTAFDGVATIELNNQQNAPVAPFYIQAGFAINALFKSLKISADAQPGKKIRLMYSTGERVVPALSGTLQVTGTVATLEEARTYGAAHKSSTNLAALAVETIFSAAANTNGAVIHRAVVYARMGASAIQGLLAKSSAPVSAIDGDVIVQTDNSANIGSAFDSAFYGKLETPIFIPAGKGLYYIASDAGVNSHRSVLYTLN